VNFHPAKSNKRITQNSKSKIKYKFNEIQLTCWFYVAESLSQSVSWSFSLFLYFCIFVGLAVKVTWVSQPAATKKKNYLREIHEIRK